MSGYKTKQIVKDSYMKLSVCSEFPENRKGYKMIELFKPSNRVPPDFADAYDRFIGETETECVERLLHKLAKDFYSAGYERERFDERRELHK